MNAHFLMREGKPAFAVLPIEDYEKLMELLEDALDSAAIEEFATRLSSGEAETIPADVADMLLDGGNPVRILRAWRELTLKQLAASCGVTDPHISQIEQGKRSISTQLLKKMATALNVDIELLV